MSFSFGCLFTEGKDMRGLQTGRRGEWVAYIDLNALVGIWLRHGFGGGEVKRREGEAIQEKSDPSERMPGDPERRVSAKV
jgi:hypothetical protein